jgi:hypothetical protein
MIMKELRVTTRDQLLEVTRTLAVRSDWHEPEEQGVTARVHGECLDNAGFWGTEQILGSLRGPVYSGAGEELWAELFQDGEPVAEVNLADLLAWATAGDHGLA